MFELSEYCLIQDFLFPEMKLIKRDMCEFYRLGHHYIYLEELNCVEFMFDLEQSLDILLNRHI